MFVGLSGLVSWCAAWLEAAGKFVPFLQLNYDLTIEVLASSPLPMKAVVVLLEAQCEFCGPIHI